MTAPAPHTQPMIDLVQDLRMDAEMLHGGHQKNLSELWHSDVVKEAALNALKAAEVIATYRADQKRDETVIASLKARIEELKAALGIAINVFEGMNDDEINEELLPTLRRAILNPTGAK